MSEALTMQPPGEIVVKRAPTVYFIDDSATMREVIKIAFRRENINVITCADAASALAQFEVNRPDVVITDVIMPDQDGYSVCSQIKQHPDLAGIPVVLMSGVVNKSVADKAVAVQADELIRKPFQPQELLGRVKSLLAPKEPVAPVIVRERGVSNPLQSLFAPTPVLVPPPAPVSVMEQVSPQATVSVPEPSVNTMSDQSVFSSPASPQSVHTPGAAPTSDISTEPAWPRALAEAFTPLLPPFAAHQSHAQTSPPIPVPPQPVVSQLPVSHSVTSERAQSSTQHVSPPSPHEGSRMRAEVARLELLVKKLQNELQLEREYNQALEHQIRTLMAES